MTDDDAPSKGQVSASATQYSLISALLERRSRRFAKGLSLDGGPLSYQSREPARPLTLEEEATLAFAACGITGAALGELPFDTGDVDGTGAGNIMVQFVGRTAASGDATHSISLVVINDDGAWLVRRPQDFGPAEQAELIAAGREHRFIDFYKQARVQLDTERVHLPREMPFEAPFNIWSVNRPGTTYFLPVLDYSELYINMMLTAFDPQLGLFVVDDRNQFKAAGVGQFARSQGGFLFDDPEDQRVAPVTFLEASLRALVTVELGGMLQNLGLMTQALGLGGFPHDGSNPAWMSLLGFDLVDVPFSTFIGAGRFKRRLIKVMGKDAPVQTAVGLRRDGKTLINAYCPPHYATMREAVLAFVAKKYGTDGGTFRDPRELSGFKDPAQTLGGIADYKQGTVEAAIAYLDYVYGRYGRIPATTGPLGTFIAYQAHELDVSFYDRFFKPDAVSATQRERAAG